MIPLAPNASTHPVSARDYLGVSLFWLALSFFWGALLTIALPAHVAALFPKNKDAALSLLTASGAAVAAVSQIVFGALSDGSRSRWGRRRPFLLWGTLLAIPPLLWLGQAHSLAALLVAYAALQLFINVAGGPYTALMHDVIPPEKHNAASTWIGVSGLIGRIGGPFVASILLGQKAGNSFALLLEVFAAVLLVVMLLTLLLAHEEPLSALPNATTDYAPPPIALPVGEGTPPPAAPAQRIRDTFRVPLRPYPSFVWLIVSRFGIMMGIYTVSNFLLYYIRDTLGFSDAASLGVLRNFLILSTLTGIVGTIPSGMLAQKYGRKPVLYGANLICMAAGLAFALAHNITFAYVAAGIFGAGFGAFSAVDWALATGLLPPTEPAKYMGVWGLSDTVSQVLAPVAAGPLAFFVNHALGGGAGYRALMLLALVWFLVGTVALRPIEEKH